MRCHSPLFGRSLVLHRRARMLASLLLAGALAACNGSGEPSADAPANPPAGLPTSGVVAFVGVNVVAMDGPIVLPDQTVVTRDGRISAVGAASIVDVPADAQVIDGQGRYLLPGLADMHVHMHPFDTSEYVRHGVTTVRNMWGTPTVQRLQEDIERGDVRGPTIYATSPGLDGTPATWPLTRLVLDADDADAAVAEQEAAGWIAIKIYQQLTADAYFAIAEAARARNLPIMGHVPHRVGLSGVLQARQHSIEHLGGIAEFVTTVGGRGTRAWRGIERSRVYDAVAQIRQAGTWVCPTLGVHRLFMQRFSATGQQAIVDNQRFVLRELAMMNVGLLVGTDSGIDLTEPGRSIHEELAEWSAAGLEPYQVLRAATVDAARFLGEDAEFGKVQAGMRADLLLVSANPLEDLRVLSSPVGVMLRGDWIPAAP